MIVYINELGQIVVKATALQLPGQEHSRAGQKKSLPGKTKPTKVTQVAGQGAVVLAEDKLSFDCQRLTSFFSALRVAEAHAQNFLNKLLLLYDI